MIPISYLLHYDPLTLTTTELEVASFDDTGHPVRWKIVRSLSCMSKYTGLFCVEPNPSNRDEEYFDEFRFNNIEDALSSYKSFGYIENTNI